MNAPQKSPARIRPEEYLALEEKALFRHEYLDGVIYAWQGDVPEAMAGGTMMHNRIVQNIVAVLRPQLKNTGCSTYATDVRLHVLTREAYFYPDVAVTCSEADERAARMNCAVFREPCIVFEVLADSTEAFDRGAKFEAYRAIPTLREYVLVSSRGRHIEVFRRSHDATWSVMHFDSGAIVLESLDARLLLEDIYENVQFDAAIPGASSPSL